MEDRPWFRQTGHGVAVFVRLTPRAARDAVEGIGESADGQRHLKARVRAAPEAGRANRALEKLIARWLGVPVGNVSVARGATSRLKTVAVVGEPAKLASLCRRL